MLSRLSEVAVIKRTELYGTETNRRNHTRSASGACVQEPAPPSHIQGLLPCLWMPKELHWWGDTEKGDYFSVLLGSHRALPNSSGYKSILSCTLFLESEVGSKMWMDVPKVTHDQQQGTEGYPCFQTDLGPTSWGGSTSIVTAPFVSPTGLNWRGALRVMETTPGL